MTCSLIGWWILGSCGGALFAFAVVVVVADEIRFRITGKP